MSFTITNRSTGHSFPAIPGASVLQAALSAGYVLRHSCRTGLCQTCKTPVLSGTVTYEGSLYGDSHLSEQDRADGFALLCQARAKSDLLIDTDELSGIESFPIKTVPCRVIGLDKVAPDVMLVRLRLPSMENMRYAPGQHIGLIIDDKTQRTYSIANDCKPEGVTELELQVRHMPGGLFTDKLFNGLRVGQLLKFEGPLGTFFLQEKSNKPIIFLASGTGFSPIKAMMEHIIKRGIHRSRKIDLYWGGRRRADLYLFDLAQRWSEEHESIRFVPVLSEPSDACAWSGSTGLVHAQVMKDHPDLSGHQVYACGAPLMIRAARSDFATKCNMDARDFLADEFLSQSDR
ncbi:MULTISPECIES: CDP-6-deoxy-delta-3,4-glucoseen reductase [unclassified Beijerinckia]|uniref:CDP-6-deoxy-delta-3,4-glucoseen reductase n=1 Tax=unclassified Beijerinckia TaxID=2638183 RepID=UPI00089B2D49|nr:MULTISPECIES: CDP-6-deoxy-delta-3,4-glucoseen reductase [unclassified Beijerinckia]MDH7798925.1 CDP-4-dehydro-6-deoxyglucose reductase [Beijerinckia sp. GAS462]SED86821.1 CDP-4-dehydro-6-deoxyglucose reductase [Beijerinckia sp. 28-YEA-48]